MSCLVIRYPFPRSCFFFFNDTAPTEIYTLSLHDALPISCAIADVAPMIATLMPSPAAKTMTRSEEHTSELQSHVNLVCRLLLEKKNRPHRDAPNAPNTERPLHCHSQLHSQTALFLAPRDH